VDVLEIDKSFVLSMNADEHDAVIVRSAIELGHNLGLEVVAEGVETAETWDELERLGCDLAQGFYLSRPMPASDMAGWLALRPPGRGRRRLSSASPAEPVRSEGGATRRAAPRSAPRSDRSARG
jgi:sensor c-di-GMP phosphodiesterase-like protein